MLVDCLGVWLTRLLDDGCWDRDPDALERLEGRVEEFLAALRATRRSVVFVSNEVGLGVVPATSSGRLFTDQLGASTCGRGARRPGLAVRGRHSRAGQGGLMRPLRAFHSAVAMYTWLPVRKHDWADRDFPDGLLAFLGWGRCSGQPLVCWDGGPQPRPGRGSSGP